MQEVTPLGSPHLLRYGRTQVTRGARGKENSLHTGRSDATLEADHRRPAYCACLEQ